MATRSKTREVHEVAVVTQISTSTESMTRPNRNKKQEQLKPEIEIQSRNVVDELREKLHKISFGEPKDSSTHALPRITSALQLKQELVLLCNEVFNVLGPFNLEATYQRALALELQDRGITVLSEVEIPIEYKGQPIATRRVDLYLKLDKPVILELKAVVTGLKTEHLKQLQFYMTHFKVNEGYLINFPHVTGFPDDNNMLCIEHVLQPKGGLGVSDRVTRSSVPRKNMMPTIIHVQQVKTTRRKTVLVESTPFFL
ncbi:unnamed protein product [Peronospora farinosa]|uniref:GxxExxY protein n=1 Tax=Peronospora farinosa TaxID=134698 RepID=A0AAV0TP18_9STRA|nr:unnamed protein product [Peronospora farinosa]